MVSLVAKPVEFGLSYNFESLGSVILNISIRTSFQEIV
jgi:hypothetical protein